MLFEWVFNIDGTISDSLLGDPVPSGVNDAGFNYSTGIGTLTVSVSGAGSHVAGLFLDHEIDEGLNGFMNEFGAAVNLGSKPTGLSWEIDEPEYVFGNIYTNFTAGALDNSNGVPSGSPDDVSMALLWSFDLLPGQSATLTFAVSDIEPSDFYLSQTDPDSPYAIYMTGGLGVTGGPAGVPEPTSLIILAAGLAGLVAAGLRARSSRRRR
ncbi:MAG: PEP-CTERM sorting domain-containing protein [Candidatus Rokubacteria bacterium]|nr:PEP-CTERM sorting domain-containing protein [Candidatus Rokubacteria bacterium]